MRAQKLWPWSAILAFLVPLVVLGWLFVWTQSVDPFSVDATLKSAARRLESLAVERLAQEIELLQYRAEEGAIDASEPQIPWAENLPGGAGSWTPLVCSRRATGGLDLVDPKSPRAKEIVQITEDNDANQSFEVFLAALEERAFVRDDRDGATRVLEMMRSRFATHGATLRLALLEVAFLNHQKRCAEAAAQLVDLAQDVEPSFAPSRDELPFLASALLLLDRGFTRTNQDHLALKERILAAIDDGALPLAPAELRALARELTMLTARERQDLFRQAAGIEAGGILAGDSGQVVADALERAAGSGAVVAGGKLWIGGVAHGELRMLVAPAVPGLESLTRSLNAGLPDFEGLVVSLRTFPDVTIGIATADISQIEPTDGESPNASAPEGSQSLRRLAAPAGIEGTVLQVFLIDRTPFEGRARQQRLFVAWGTICLALALVVLGLATFRAVRRELAAARARSDFLAAVSHELRTPLASIRTFAELLDEGRLSDESVVKRSTRLILSNCRRLGAMIENVLNLSRSERRALRYRPRKVDLSALLNALLRDLQALAEIEDRRLTMEIVPDLAPVRADPAALERAVFNLVDNALKYGGCGQDGKPDSIDITVHLDDNHVVLTVTDHGPGIAADERKTIFEPFQRGRAGREVPAGVGLGLSLAREAIESCGGRLELESSRDLGATFKIVLPCWTEGEKNGDDNFEKHSR